MKLNKYFKTQPRTQIGYGNDAETNDSARSIQYRLDDHGATPIELYKRLYSCCFPRRKKRSGIDLGMSPNQVLASYMHWMFR